MGKIAASVLLKLFINGNKNTTYHVIIDKAVTLMA